jgi:hypothetical protein
MPCGSILSFVVSYIHFFRAIVREGMRLKRALFSFTPNCDCKLHQDKQVCGAGSPSEDYDYDGGSEDYDYDDDSEDYDYNDDSEDYDYDGGSEDYDYDGGSDYRSEEPAPQSSPEPAPQSSPEPAPDSSPAILEKFNLEMDWNPTSCYKIDECSASKIVNAFTITEMRARLCDRSRDNTRCWKKDSDQAKGLVVSDEVSKGTLRALECMFENAAGANEDLWRDLFVNVGSCTGMSPEVYFGTMTRLYMSVGLNSIVEDFKTKGSVVETGTSITVDRDEFLDYVSERLGRKAWIECDPDTRLLRVVLVCVNPLPPYDIIDCTMDRNDPTSTNGIPCAGSLSMPLNSQGGNANGISESCSQYMLEPPADLGVATTANTCSPDAAQDSFSPTDENDDAQVSGQGPRTESSGISQNIFMVPGTHVAFAITVLSWLF